MMHPDRPFQIHPRATMDSLARSLRGSSVLCTGFTCSTLTVVNDSSSEDAIQEWAVIREGRQVESLTAAWFEHRELQECLERLDQGQDLQDFGNLHFGRKYLLQPHPEGSCPLCA